MIKTTGLSIVMVLLLGAMCESAAASQGERPNVLFIAVDDLNTWVGHLGGHVNARTPNIDRLARRGVSFSKAYSAAPLCNPSRISLMTGIAPSKSGIYGNREMLRDRLPDAVTLMQHFRASGYAALGSGKIFHGTKAYDDDSWDRFHVVPRSRKGLPIHRQPAEPTSVWAPWGPLSSTDEEMFDFEVASWAISQLEASHDQPFFLAAGFTKPHLPWRVPQKYFDLHPLDEIELPATKEGDLDDVPEFGKKLAREVYDASDGKNFAHPGGDHQNVLAHNQWSIAVQAYLATISFADAQVGRILDALDASEHADNTIVVLWGDHGWHLGEKDHWRKHALWDVTTRTPLIVSAPNGVAVNRLCDRPVGLIDVYPTLVELAGLPEKDGVDGRSLVPLLENPDHEWDRPVVMTYGYRNHAVQTSRWRYIEYHDGTAELYDHENDPHEWTNLATRPEHQAVLRDLRSSLPKINRE